jgi:hypothetical protein
VACTGRNSANDSTTKTQTGYGRWRPYDEGCPLARTGDLLAAIQWRRPIRRGRTAGMTICTAPAQCRSRDRSDLWSQAASVVQDFKSVRERR